MDIKQIRFDGLDAVEIQTPRLRLVAVSSFGPRIALLSVDGGDNLFYWDASGAVHREDWQIHGGHRVWNTRPGADESEDAYAADNGPCSVSMEGDALVLTGQEHPFLRTRRGIKIQPVDDLTFKVTSFVTNCGDMLFSGGAWAITCSNPKGGHQYGIPLGDRSKPWDLVQIIIPRSWAGHHAKINDPQIHCTEEFMIVDPQGVETKRMLMVPFGIIAMTLPDKNLSFIKQVDYIPGGQYPLGCNLAFYIGPDNFMLEMETMGPERTLFPGDTIEHTETWKVVDRVMTWQDPKELSELFK